MRATRREIPVWANFLALLFFLLLLCWLLAGFSQAKETTKTFRVTGERAADGTLLIEPMIAPALGVEVQAGEPPAKHDVLNCAVETKIVGKVEDGGVTRVYLDCGKTRLAVKGILFR